jgi:hypothetical protein
MRASSTEQLEEETLLCELLGDLWLAPVVGSWDYQSSPNVGQVESAEANRSATGHPALLESAATDTGAVLRTERSNSVVQRWRGESLRPQPWEAVKITTVLIPLIPSVESRTHGSHLC